MPRADEPAFRAHDVRPYAKNRVRGLSRRHASPARGGTAGLSPSRTPCADNRRFGRTMCAPTEGAQRRGDAKNRPAHGGPAGFLTDQMQYFVTLSGAVAGSTERDRVKSTLSFALNASSHARSAAIASFEVSSIILWTPSMKMWVMS